MVSCLTVKQLRGPVAYGRGLGLALGIMWLTLSGCLSPIAMHRAVLEYDRTATELEAEMLLLNIARTSHFRPLHFTTISSVAATFDFSASGGFNSLLYQRVEPPNQTLFMTVGGSVAERPTVTIIPIQGEEFTSRILTPFDETKLAFLFQQGIEPGILLRLMVREIVVTNGGHRGLLRNNPSRREEYEEFRRRVYHLASLHNNRSLYVSPIVFEEPLPITIDHKLTEGMMSTVMDATEKQYRWTAANEKTPLTFTKRMMGRVVITNYDLHTLTNEERRQLQREAERNPPNTVLVDIRPTYPGGDYPLHGMILLRSFNAILRFLALGITTGPEYHVERDPRSPEGPQNPPSTIQIDESDKRPGDSDFAVEYEGKWYSIKKAPRTPGARAPWNQEAFRVLAMLYQVTVTDVSRVPTPAITIAK